MSLRQDTIAAIATPLGEGGIAVIRVSGPDAFRIVTERLAGSSGMRRAKSHSIHVGYLKKLDGTILDQVVCAVFHAPNSYTGENVVEVSCHGGMLVTRRILEELLTAGARHANPGEFTQRAFLNGKLDLAQAEAVADLIHANSDKAHRTSLTHLKGEFSAGVESMRSSLIDALGLLELELDFAEDGYEFVDKEKVRGLVEATLRKVEKLLTSYTIGRAIRDGVQAVLVGAPNVGKSSLMNRLLKESRAIVTEIPGTTRDVISENIFIDGVLFRLSDTAGIRKSDDPAEQEGVRKSREKLGIADVIVLVIDATRPFGMQLQEIGTEAVEFLQERRKKVQVALNKVDLEKADAVHENRGHVAPPLEGLNIGQFTRVSALTGEGIQELEGALLAHVPGFDVSGPPEGEVVTSARHHSAFLRVAEYLRLAKNSIDETRTSEFIAVDLRGALDSLGEVTGRIANEDVMNEIFGKFCIGK